MNALHELKEKFRPIIATYVDDDVSQTDSMLAMIRPAGDAKHGDFQANFAMPLGKKAGQPPREVADAIVAKADLSDICQNVEIAGPGFINLKLDDQWIKQSLKLALADERLGGRGGEITPQLHRRLFFSQRRQTDARRSHSFDRDWRCVDANFELHRAPSQIRQSLG